MSLPLDEDGFVRRECPTCEREFKWHHAEEGEASSPVPDGGYYCPYCVIQAGPDQWFTKPQIKLAEQTVAHEFVGPELDKVLGGFNKRSGRGGGLEIKMTRSSGPEKPTPLDDEPNDMRRVVFECHPEEPVKVLEDWTRPVHCLICGSPA